MSKLLILDKDGTLVQPKSGARFVQHPKDQELLPGVSEALRRYVSEGWHIAIASNQGGVAAGHKTLDEAIAEMAYCLDLLTASCRTAVFCPDFEGDRIEFVCRHGAGSGINRVYLSNRYSKEFEGFRKPNPGMIQALQHFFLSRIHDERKSYLKYPCLFVGDRPEDQAAAIAANVDFMWAEEWRDGNPE